MIGPCGASILLFYNFLYFLYMADPVALAQLLGWQGEPTQIAPFRTTVTAIAEPVAEEVEWRRANGLGAHSKSDLALFEILDNDAWRRPDPVRLSGVIVEIARGRSAIAAASMFAGICERAVLLPRQPRSVEALLLEARFFGVTLAAPTYGGGVEILHRGGPGKRQPARGIAHRLVQELTLGELLDQDTRVGTRT